MYLFILLHHIVWIEVNIKYHAVGTLSQLYRLWPAAVAGVHCQVISFRQIWSTLDQIYCHCVKKIGYLSSEHLAV